MQIYLKVRDFMWFKTKPKEMEELDSIVDALKQKPNHIYVGRNEKNELVLEDLKANKNCLFVGSMGSGKSVSANQSITAYLKANPDTLVIIVDTYKGASNFSHLKDCNQVLFFAGYQEYLNSLIDLLYHELEDRKDQKNQKNYSQILLVIEEAHCVFLDVKYSSEENVVGTKAFKLKELFRKGSHYGINIILVAQCADSRYVPKSVVSEMGIINGFRISKAEAIYLNRLKAGEFLSSQRGICHSNSGITQFKFLESNVLEKAIKKIPHTIPSLSVINKEGYQDLKFHPKKILEPQYLENILFWHYVKKAKT